MDSPRESNQKYYICTEMRDGRNMYHQLDNISHQKTADALLSVAHVDWLMHHAHCAGHLVQTAYNNSHGPAYILDDGVHFYH